MIISDLVLKSFGACTFRMLLQRNQQIMVEHLLAIVIKNLSINQPYFKK